MCMRVIACVCLYVSVHSSVSLSVRLFGYLFVYLFKTRYICLTSRLNMTERHYLFQTLSLNRIQDRLMSERAAL